MLSSLKFIKKNSLRLLGTPKNEEYVSTFFTFANFSWIEVPCNYTTTYHLWYEL